MTQTDPQQHKQRRREQRDQGSLRKRMIHGFVWLFAGTAASQALRFGSSLILTRMLAPEAFGLVAAVTLFARLLQMMSDTGISASIIRHERANDPKFLNTAWTIQVVRGVILWLLACGLAVALWYGQSIGWLTGENVYADKMLPKLLPVAALSAVITGFTNTSLALLTRDLAVGRLVILRFGTHALGIASVITLAWLFDNVWALVIGGLVGIFAQMLASHWLIPGIRQRFELERQTVGQLLRFGRWIFLGTLIGFFGGRGRRLILAAFITPAQLGVFVIGAYFASFCTKQLGHIKKRLLFPAFSRLNERDDGQFLEKFYRCRLYLTCAMLPIFAALFIGARFIIEFFYDERYRDAGWMLQLLAAGQMLRPIDLADSVALAKGDSFRHMLLRVALLVSTLLLMAIGGWHYGLAGAILGMACAPLLRYPVNAAVARHHGVWLPKLDLAHFAIGVAIIMTTFYIVGTIEFAGRVYWTR
jgi:O-antigen/teichoic acid export membrane protein